MHGTPAAAARASAPEFGDGARTPLEAADCTLEGRRIGLLLERDGPEAAREWVTRTLGIYRRALLDRSHFASTPAYKSMYVASCADFRRWLRLNRR